jgi:hypothetical protein
MTDRRHDGGDDECLDRDEELDQEDADGQFSPAILEKFAPSHRRLHPTMVQRDGIALR